MRRFIVTLALLPCADCARHAAPPEVLPRAPAAAVAPAGPTYRFLPARRGTPLGDGAFGIVDPRTVIDGEGNVEHARMVAGERLFGGLPIPARLGGGFLFWDSNRVFRAGTFLGDLEPVAAIPTNAIEVGFGPDALLVRTPGGQRRAYDLHARRVPLSPHGVIHMAGAEDGRSIALDVTGRALASIDGGKTWKDVSRGLGRVPAVHGDSSGLWFELARHQGAWLEPDGTLARRDVPPQQPATDQATLDADRYLTLAVRQGIVLPGRRALVASLMDLFAVDLDTGKVVGRMSLGGTAGICEPLSADEGGLVACYIPGRGVRVFSHVIEPKPRLERVFPEPRTGGVARLEYPAVYYGASTLLVAAPCYGGEAAGVVCERHGGLWTEHDARPLLAGREVLRWVPEEGGGAAAIVARTARPGSRRELALLDVRTRRETVFDQDLDVGRAGTSYFVDRHHTDTGWILQESGVLRGFTQNQSVAVGPNGKVRFGTGPLAQLAPFEGSALAREYGVRLWQTTDYGAHWVEVERPVQDDELQSNVIECSQVGCVLGINPAGTMLRIGWPADPPRARRVVPAQPPTSPATSIAPAPAPPRPTLDCAGLDGRPPKGPVAPPRDGRAKLEAEVTELRRRLERAREVPLTIDERPSDTSLGGAASTALVKNWASVPYFDRFDGPGTDNAIPQALRALALYEAPMNGAVLSMPSLVRSKKPIEVLYTEDFDPARSVMRATGSFAQWQDTTFPDRATTYGFDGEVRPVLSTQPGHANGVILIDGALRFWVGGGKLRPIRLEPYPCRPFGGYVDAHGRLLVACQGEGGATTIEDAETEETISGAPQVFPTDRERLALVESSPTGPIPRDDLDVADTIATARDGGVGILRLPSGSEPASVDDPAWFLSDDPQPVELAPWSTLRIATSPECAKSDDDVRALMQTSTAWVNVAGATGFRTAPGMRALVRWNRDRVCLEAIELGYRGLSAPSAPLHASTEVMLVARFTGEGAGSSLVALTSATSYHEAVRCTLR
jgi:hypothetical protein